MAHAIFLTFDDSYGMYARACLNSIVRNFPAYPQLLVFYEGNNAETLRYLSGIERLELLSAIEKPALKQDITLGIVNSATVYNRYYLWTDAFDRFDNIMYLDVDTIVLKPLTAIFQGDDFFVVADCSAHAHVRVFSPGALKDERLLALLQQDQLPLFQGQDDMCNAGVFVIPRRYRTAQHYNLLVQLTNRYDRYLQFADQSAISLWCHKNGISFLRQFEYNFQATHFATMELDLDDVAILHYSSRFKPNTVEFMLRKDLSCDRRKQLARLFFDYVNEAVPAQ